MKTEGGETKVSKAEERVRVERWRVIETRDELVEHTMGVWEIGEFSS